MHRFGHRFQRNVGTWGIGFVIATGALAGVSAAAPPPDKAPPAQLWSEKAFAKPLDPDAPVSMRAFSQLAKELSPAVVNIAVVRPSAPQLPFFGETPSQGLGTGFIIHADGYVLTNHHVIEEAKSITVKLANDHEYEAKVVGAYAPLDVALLKLEPQEKLVVAPLGSSDRLEIGEWVVAIGNPFGLAHTVTAGIVSAKGRRDVVPAGGDASYAGFIQTDASINPGNSGGPLINIRGEVVGINTAINAAGQGIGFAVPIDMVKTVVGQLAKGKVERSYIGVRVGPVPKEIAEKLGDKDGHPTGAMVKSVIAGSPAAKAGLVEGDVIVTWNEKALEDWHDLPWLASTAGAGQSVAIVVNHQGEVQKKSLKLAPYPENEVAGGDGRADGAASPLGMTVTSVPTATETALGLGKGEGVVVSAVDAGGVAAALGMKVGDLITQVNYQPVKNGTKGFEEAVGRVGAGEILAFTVRRGDRFMFKAFTR